MDRNGLEAYGVLKAYLEGLGGRMFDRPGGPGGGTTYFIHLRGKWAKIHVPSVQEANPLDNLHVPHGDHSASPAEFYHQLKKGVFWHLVDLFQKYEVPEGPTIDRGY